VCFVFVSLESAVLRGGHKSASMVILYDHDVPLVEPATPRQKLADFYE